MTRVSVRERDVELRSGSLIFSTYSADMDHEPTAPPLPRIHTCDPPNQAQGTELHHYLLTAELLSRNPTNSPL